MTLSDVLEKLLAKQPGQTAQDLYDALTPSVRSKVPGSAVVATAMRTHPDRFVCVGDRWNLAGSSLLAARASNTRLDSEQDTRAVPRVSAAVSDAADDPARLERQLIDRLEGCRIVAEIGLDAELHGEVTNALEAVLRRSPDIARVGRIYPALLAVHLVSQGVYHYRDGGYWNVMTIGGIDATAGPAFEDALRRLGLETFEDLVLGDGALRFVGPILAHGGIPKHSLGDYFVLLARGLKQGSNAGELLTRWRTQKTTFVGIDRPVRRFLLFGGDLAVDYIDRSIDLVREHARSGEFLSPDQVGLPPYVVTAFQRFVAAGGDTSISARSGPSVEIVVDPWDGSGPVAELPALSGSSGSGWRVYGEGDSTRVPVSKHAAHRVRLAPSKAWTVELLDDTETMSEYSFEGLDSIPALFFDPRTGRLLRTGAGIRLEAVWVLTPAEVVVKGIGRDGERTPLRLVEELPDPTGSWTGYRMATYDLVGMRSVSVTEPRSGVERRIVVRSPGERPSLVGARVTGVEGASGVEVFAETPRLVLPGLDTGEATKWRVRLTVNGESADLDPFSLDRAYDGLLLPVGEGSASVSLVVRGPLGADLRTVFVVVPGLVAARPDRLLFPGEIATVAVRAPALRIEGGEPGQSISFEFGAEVDQVRFTVASEGGASLGLTLRIARLLWSVIVSGESGANLGAQVSVLTSDQLTDVDPPRLMVRTGDVAHELRLCLVSAGATLQQSDQVFAGGAEGRWAFDLGRFCDTVALSEATRFDLVLWVGSHPVTVATIRAAFEVSNLAATSEIAGDIACVSLTFEPLRPLKYRVARLWSLPRPWERPIVEPVGEGPVSSVEIYGEGTIPLGRYLAELAIEDGWGAVTRPRRDAANTTRVDVGSPAEVRGRRLADDDPLSPLEAALSQGHFSRALVAEEREIVVPAAVEVLILMLQDQLLYDRSSRQFRAVCALALSDIARFVTALLDLAETDRADTQDLRRLAVAAAGALRPTTQLSPSVARRLWAAGPAIAAALEMGTRSSEEQQERVEEFTGWPMAESSESIAVGEAVTQQFLGIGAAQLEDLRRELDLVPGNLFDLDAYLLANFEWLLADKRSPGLAAEWWRKQSRMAGDAVARFPTAARHLASRLPPPGTESWAALPMGTLGAALELVSDRDRVEEGTRALLDALEFAPRLVQRDLVLARALLLEPTPEDDV